MARVATALLVALTGFLAPSPTVRPEPAATGHGAPTVDRETFLAHLDADVRRPASDDRPAPLTPEQQQLVEHAISRFEAQGLALPELDFVFHEDLGPCDGHKGRFHISSRTVEMCTMEPRLMLHELAHAWAEEHLDVAVEEQFVSTHGLDSWNDHDHAWERRGTEHVAETIAWGLIDDPHHVRWVETLADGSTRTTHRILTIDVDVDTLFADFTEITGMDPVFRHPDEWAVEAVPEAEPSSEVVRIGR